MPIKFISLKTIALESRNFCPKSNSKEALAPTPTKPSITKRSLTALNRLAQPQPSPGLPYQALATLKAKINASYRKIRESAINQNAPIIPRTAAHNRKCTYTSIEEERACRANLLSDQIRTWRNLMPSIIRRFSKIPDPRNPKKIKHKITVLMI